MIGYLRGRSFGRNGGVVGRFGARIGISLFESLVEEYGMGMSNFQDTSRTKRILHSI